jgi:hypothetical protein
MRLWDAIASGSLDSACQPLVESFFSRGWVTVVPLEEFHAARVPNVSPRGANWVGAFVCISRAFLDVHFRGFAASYGRARRAANLGLPIQPLLDPEFVLDLAIKKFQSAECWVPSGLGLSDCLPRSLALFTYLRFAGLNVRHRIGVKLYPFAAHAWVEDWNGRTILDYNHRIASFTSLALLG